MNDTKQCTEDLKILEQLNNDYVHSDQFNDVKRFSEFLAEDFIVQTPGVTRNREEFLDYIAKPRPIKDLGVHDASTSGSLVMLLWSTPAPHTPRSPMEWTKKLCTRTHIRSATVPGSVSQPVRSLQALKPARKPALFDT